MRYFPFLRGKLHEMRALKKIATDISDHGDVVPIIEPVRDNLNNLKGGKNPLSFYDEFIDCAMPFLLICNPKLGHFKKDHPRLKDKIVDQHLSHYTKWIPSLYVDSSTSLEEIRRFRDDYTTHSCALIYRATPSPVILNAMNDTIWTNFDYHVYFEGKIPDSFKSSLPFGSRVKIVDHFNRKDPNSEYRNDPLEIFTELNTIEGNPTNENFGDFSTQGVFYTESTGGQDPITVALHHVHFNINTDRSQNALYISHFVSDHREFAGVTSELILEVLSVLCNELDVLHPNDTKACQVYREMLHNNRATNAQTLKQLSIQHHLEVMLSERGLEG